MKESSKERFFESLRKEVLSRIFVLDIFLDTPSDVRAIASTLPLLKDDKARQEKRAKGIVEMMGYMSPFRGGRTNSFSYAVEKLMETGYLQEADKARKLIPEREGGPESADERLGKNNAFVASAELAARLGRELGKL